MREIKGLNYLFEQVCRHIDFYQLGISWSTFWRLSSNFRHLLQHHKMDKVDVVVESVRNYQLSHEGGGEYSIYLPEGWHFEKYSPKTTFWVGQQFYLMTTFLVDQGAIYAFLFTFEMLANFVNIPLRGNSLWKYPMGLEYFLWIFPSGE